MEHEMVVSGIVLKEKKELTTITVADNSEKSVLNHTRTIGDRVYQVKKVTQNGVDVDTTVNTEMTEAETQQFEQDWYRMWQPTIPEDQTSKDMINSSFKDEAQEIQPAPITYEDPEEPAQDVSKNVDQDQVAANDDPKADDTTPFPEPPP